MEGLAQRGLSPAEALRQAMLEFVDNPQSMDDPYPGVWGAFVMYGLMPAKATTWSRIPTAQQSSVRPMGNPSLGRPTAPKTATGQNPNGL